MFSEATILVVKGESEDAENIVQALRYDYQVIGPDEPDEALSRVSRDVDVVITELDSTHSSGLDFLRAWRERQSRTRFIVLVAKGDVNSAVEAMKFGAADCLEKPVELERLRTSLATVLLSKDNERRDGIRPAESAKDAKKQIEIPPGTSLEDLERAAVEQALAQHQGNRTHAARTLGISVRTLQRKLKAWGVPLWSQNHSGNQGKPFLIASYGRRATKFITHVHH